MSVPVGREFYGVVDSNSAWSWATTGDVEHEAELGKVHVAESDEQRDD